MSKKSKVLGCKIIVQFDSTNVITREDLIEFYSGNMGECVRKLIEEDGLFGCFDEKMTILSVEEA